MLLNKIKRFLMGLTGFILLMIAIFLLLFPILPVRPLLKLIELCFFNSSAKIYDWFTKHKIFGTIINKKREISKKQFCARLIITFIVLFGIMFFVTNVFIRTIATVIFVFRIIYDYYRTLE